MQPADMKLSRYRLHPLTAAASGACGSGNWHIVARFEDRVAVHVTLIDYH